MTAAVLETLAYRAPLAVHCEDSCTGADVADGLVVSVWPAGDPGAAVLARRSPVSALFGVGSLPGLRAEEWTAVRGGPPAWPVAPPIDVVVQVMDTAGRYLTQVLHDSVAFNSVLTVTLYSAPARPAPPGWAQVRGEVTTAAGAAAWALVHVTAGGMPASTACDGAGRFLLYLPYPEMLPPLGGPGGLGTVTWPVSLTVDSQPSALQWLPAVALPPGVPPAATVPTTESILGQAAAAVTAGAGATLTLGQSLRLAPVVTPA